MVEGKVIEEFVNKNHSFEGDTSHTALNDLIGEKTIYSVEGEVSEVKEGNYKEVETPLIKEARTKLKGTFYTNSNGIVYYVDDKAASVGGGDGIKNDICYSLFTDPSERVIDVHMYDEKPRFVTTNKNSLYSLNQDPEKDEYTYKLVDENINRVFGAKNYSGNTHIIYEKDDFLHISRADRLTSLPSKHQKFNEVSNIKKVLSSWVFITENDELWELERGNDQTVVAAKIAENVKNAEILNHNNRFYTTNDDEFYAQVWNGGAWVYRHFSEINNVKYYYVNDGVMFVMTDSELYAWEKIQTTL